MIPDFNLWNWGSSLSDPGLREALSPFLQGIIAAFYNTLETDDNPTTAGLLITRCLEVLDDRSKLDTPKLRSALHLFAAVIWRSDPRAFEEGPSLADALLTSTEACGGNSGRAEVLATQLRAVAYGPKYPISIGSDSLTRLDALYAGLPKTGPRCFEGFLDAYAATLEAALAVDGHLTILGWRHSPDYEAARNILTNPLFAGDDSFDFVLQHPNYRLPYLYSFAIALSYTTEGRDRVLWKVVDLLARLDGQGITIDRALDTNILVVNVLYFATTGTVEQAQKTKFLDLLDKVIADIASNSRAPNPHISNPQTWCKCIYLIEDHQEKPDR